MTSREQLVAFCREWQAAYEKVNRDHGKIPYKNVVLKVEPMVAPEGLLFYLDRLK